MTIARDDSGKGGSLWSRLFSGRAATMLARNTVVSCCVFALNLLLLWVLVEFIGMGKILAAALAFVMVNGLHAALGRAWIFPESDRSAGASYALFFINAGIGLAITVSLFAAMTEYTSINYLVARVIVSLFAGLAVFVLNAVLNFRSL